MGRAYRIAVVALVTLIGVASAADHPLTGAKLTLLRSSSGRAKLALVAKDPAFLFPAIGSADDPSSVGALFEIASAAEFYSTTFYLPRGVGKPGWRSQHGSRDAYVYDNPLATPGPYAVRVLHLKQGRLMKIVGVDVGVALDGPQGAVGVRLTIGSLRSCARFDPPTIRKDVAGHFVATGSNGSTMTDCSQLSPPPPTTTTTMVFDSCAGGDPATTCGGACTGDDQCAPSRVITWIAPESSCACYPPDVTPCGDAEYPACGGACSGSFTCQAITFGADHSCACVDSAARCPQPGTGFPNVCTIGRCPPGQACAVTVGPSVYCECTPQ